MESDDGVVVIWVLGYHRMQLQAKGEKTANNFTAVKGLVIDYYYIDYNGLVIKS